MDVLKKILNIVIDIFIFLVVIISAIIAIISVSASKTGVANFFGYVPFSVQTDSMSPAFEAGDLIVSKKMDTQGADIDYEFKKGDVVTFWTTIEDDNGNKETVMNTHRILDLVPDREGKIYAYETKGDNNLVKDKETVNKAAIVALWSTGDQPGIKVAKLGSVLAFLRKPSGFFIAVVIPMIIFFIYELVRFITNFMNYNKEKQKEAALQAAKELMGDGSSDSSGLSEDQKAQAILEYLEKQKTEQAAAPPAENAPPAQEAPAPAEAAPAEPEAAQEQPASEESTKAEETKQPAAEQSTEAVTEPEQDETVSEASED
ncbi:MAG: signal peptidase I [Clostridia bacterium]|nr:signal peptidase I [Clostridia bacterium]